jgi:hypothetical protein
LAQELGAFVDANSTRTGKGKKHTQWKCKLCGRSRNTKRKMMAHFLEEHEDEFDEWLGEEVRCACPCAAVCAAYCTLHTAHCTLHTAHCTLHTAHCTLHTAHCMHTAYCILHTTAYC